MIKARVSRWTGDSVLGEPASDRDCPQRASRMRQYSTVPLFKSRTRQPGIWLRTPLGNPMVRGRILPEYATGIASGKAPEEKKLGQNREPLHIITDRSRKQ